MKSIISQLIIIVSICLFSKNTFGNRNVILNDEKKMLGVGLSLLIYEDKSNQLTFKDIESKLFLPSNNLVPNLGITNSTFWIKIPITNVSNQSHFLLNLSLSSIDFVEFYDRDENNKLCCIQMGEHLPFSKRKYDYPDYIFDIRILPHQSKIIYLKLKCKEALQLPIKIGSTELVLEEQKNNGILIGIFVGIMLVMILYNLFIYFSVKDNSYLYYVFYIVLVALTQTSIHGFTFQYLWPNFPLIAQYSLFIFPAFVGMAGIKFMTEFLNVKTQSKILNGISTGLYIPYTIAIILLFFNEYKISHFTIQINAILVSLHLLIVPIVMLRKGFGAAKYFLIAWSVFLVGVFCYVLKDLGILPFNYFTQYTMIVGSAIETVLLSFALADRINIYKKEKEKSQEQALKALQEHEKLITDQNVILEQKVEERTTELKNTLTNLKDTQSQLVNVEKMASLGQLTAGIAHEINNPINFVSANVKPLKMDIDDVLTLVNKYEALIPSEINAKQFKEIDDYRKEIDIDYIKEEMASLLVGIEDGAKRTTEIVLGLKNFSRLDESDVKEVNINDGIQSTLVLLRNTFPENLEVVVNLEKIPNIECLPGKLNQVFMNLLSNALFAISKNKSKEKHKLVVKSYELNNQIFVSIEDTGIGMSEEVKSKIFEPFFTTKDVGEGTGLGMSIVFRILESHNAKLEIESEVGVGTKMLLILNKQINLNN